jgi:hypothetical protein
VPEVSGRGGALPAASGGGDCGSLGMTSVGPRWAATASRAGRQLGHGLTEHRRWAGWKGGPGELHRPRG